MRNVSLRLLFCFLLSVMTWMAAGQILYPFRHSGKWGFIDSSGTEVIPAKFDHATPYENGFAKARIGKTLFMVFGKDKIISIENCNAFALLKYPYFKARKNGKWWITDSLANNLSPVGYDRLWSVPNYDSLLYFQDHNRSGVITIDGRTIINSNYDNLRILTPGYFSVMQPSRMLILINSRGDRVLADSFTHLSIVQNGVALFLGILPNGEKMLFNGSGFVVEKASDIKFQTFQHGFVQIHSADGKTKFFDLEKKEIKEIPGMELRDAMPENCVFISSKKKCVLYHRYKGELLTGSQLYVSTLTYPYIFMDSFKFGLLDSNYQTILPNRYASVRNMDNNRSKVMGDNNLLAIFNHNTKKFESTPIYSSIASRKGFCKAYTPGSEMDLFIYDSSGIISEIINYKKVVSVYVDERDNEMDSLWTDIPNYAATTTPVVSNLGTRKTGWYSISGPNRYSGTWQLLYGLIVSKGKRGIKDTIIKAMYPYLEVQKTAPYSIAGYYSGFKSSGIKLQGNTIHYPNTGYFIFNDSLGQKVGFAMQFIDRADLNNSALNYLRVHSGGQMVILDKKTMQPVTGCTYASPIESNNMRRLYLGGNFALTKDDKPILNIVDAQFVQETRLYEKYYSPYFSITLNGGQWTLMDKTGKVFKPEIAFKTKISSMSSFDNAGKSIVMLVNGKYGVIDSTGATFIPAVYDLIEPMGEAPGHFLCRKKSQMLGLVSAEGEIVTPPMFTNIETKGDIYFTHIKDSCFLFNLGQEPNYIGKNKQVSGFEDGVGFIRDKKGFHLCNDEGSEVSAGYYRRAMALHNGYTPYMAGSRWGLVGSNGQVVLKAKYSDAKLFQQTTGIFEIKNRWRFVTPDGTVIPAPKHADAEMELTPGVFVYRKNNQFAMYNSEGKKLNNFRLRGKPILHDSFILICKSSNIFFYTLEGQKIGKLSALPGLREKQIEKQALKMRRKAEFGQSVVLEFSPAQLRAFGGPPPYQTLYIPLGIKKLNYMQKEYLYEAYCNDVYLIGFPGFFAFMNGNGDVIGNQSFIRAEPMQQGKSICSITAEKVGLFDNYGFWLIEPKYSGLKKLNDSIYSYKLSYKLDIVNPQGKIVNENPLDFYRYTRGLLMFKEGNKVGYYNPNGKMVYAMKE